MEVSTNRPHMLRLGNIRANLYSQALFEMYDEIGKLGMVPKMKVDKAKALV
jgi:hypothetical protein